MSMQDDERKRSAGEGRAQRQKPDAADAPRVAAAGAAGPDTGARADARAPKQQAPRPTAVEVPAPSFNRVSVAVPTLPKGGGALRAIGETFQTNPATGTGSMSIPLGLPRGRAGAAAPELALSYDSGNGNTVFGLGWSVGIPAITRKTDKGVPEYGLMEETDVFQLAGAEDLVPARKEQSPGVWVADGYNTGTYQVDRYRPRVEGAFARIERWTHNDTREVHWMVTSRSNVKSTFGLSPAARIADPAHPRKVFSWLLERVEDDRGNVATYEYVAENLDNLNVQFLACEDHRRRGYVDIGNNRHPKRIRWGNTAMGDAATAMFEVVFDYGEHDALVPAPDAAPGATWPTRQDPFSTYRAGFEIRTYRLCRRILVFHHFPELGATPCLVRSIDLAYDEHPAVTTLKSITAAGCVRNPDGVTYTRKAMPPLELGYTQPTRTATYSELEPDLADSAVLRGLGSSMNWVDLEGEGIPGLLAQNEGGYAYAHNLGAGRIARLRRLPTRPSLAGVAGAELWDVDGDGTLELVQLRAEPQGFFERDADGDNWGPFRSFKNLPRVDWSNAQVHRIDLNGDGRDDIWCVTYNDYIYFPSEGKDGFGPPRVIPRQFVDEERGVSIPIGVLPFVGVFFADMSGSGLADIVRVEATRVVYWPNLGHGKFGPMVVMSNSPHFEPGRRFDASRVRLADLDGSGTTDIVYLGPDGLDVYFNFAGNRFSNAVHVEGFPTAEALSSTTVADVRGNGTVSVTWVTSRRATGPTPEVWALDFVGQTKPYLLTSVKNNLGLETKVTYAPSTKFYLVDRAAGKPWATRLPFPVQVVEKVETFDAIARARLTKTYVYHHGAFDPDEREFRGFGMVEVSDTEAFAATDGMGVLPPGSPPVNGELAQHPVRTKTWFHTGVWRDQGKLEEAYAKEYYSPDAPNPDPRLLPPPVLPTNLTLTELKQATRALKGTMLRQEVYGEDGTTLASRPYSVMHHRSEVHLVQPARGGTGRTAEQPVFFVHDKEAISIYCEREPADPRVAHAFTLKIDGFGVVTKSATVAYGRATGDPEQQKQWAVLAETDVAHLADVTAGYRLAVPLASRVYELHGLAAPSLGPLLSFDTVHAAADAATALSYEQAPTTGSQKRLVAHVKSRYYDSASLPSPLPFGSADLNALRYESYALALTPGLLSQVFGTDVTPAILTEGGYVELAGETGQFTPSGRELPDATRFYLPNEVSDPWGNVTTLAYDAHNMFITTVTDATGNIVSAEYDYRVLAPSLVTDPNGNRRAAAFNALGHVTAEAVIGKVGSTDGDTLTDPTIKYTYELLRYPTTDKPTFIKTEVREKHGTPSGRLLTTYEYSDGSGRVAMAKVQAEAGEAPLRDMNGQLIKDAQGNLVLGTVTNRWVGTGKTVLNNKGNPVKQYEPFFSSTAEFEDEDELVQWGVTPLMHYDPPGRLVRMDLPHGGVRRVSFTAWDETSWDENDTVSDAGNLWYAARQPGTTPPPAAEEQRAATLTFAHRETPTTTKVDALGRPFLVQERLTSTTILSTRTALDIEGQTLSVTDALGRACMQYTYGVDGQLVREISIDSGERKSLSDVAGAPLRSWDAVGHVRRTVYDSLRRPTHLYVKKGAAPEYLAERTLYGESYPNPETQNLRGRAAMVFDGAGLLQTESFDFKGNLLTSTRRLATICTAEPDWAAVASASTPSAALTAAASLLETESFTKTFVYDALNRVISATYPDNSEVRPGYNDAGLLEIVDVCIRGAAGWTSFVTGIDYDALGRRKRIDYANGTFTEYAYDPLAVRLKQLKTTRTTDSAILQNLFYTHDCAGNVIAVKDTAQQTVFFNNDVVMPSAEYEYDALYRLTKASGREHAGGIGDNQRDQNDLPIHNLPHANDAQALRRYEEGFVYDAVGNFLEFIHDAGPGSPTGSWTRRYKYGAGNGDNTSNWLHSTSLPGDQPGGSYTANYTHDANGNMTAMPHLASIAYTHRDQIREANLGGGGMAYYSYDAGGERVLKRIQRIGVLVEERIYLGNYEVYRKRDHTGLLLERQTLHVMDDTRRIAMVETKTVDTSNPGSTGISRTRYEYTNHLDSALLECDGAGLVISYEEYHPYGTTAYWSAGSSVEVSQRRYRYTGKEKDEETGLYYHGARYYACWLGRWTSCDPLERIDAGRYTYVRNNPILFFDPNGMQEKSGWARLWNVGVGYASQALDYVKEANPGYQVTRSIIELKEGAAKTIETGDPEHLLRATPVGKVVTTAHALKQTYQEQGAAGIVKQIVPIAETIDQVKEAKQALERGDYKAAGQHIAKSGRAGAQVAAVVYGGAQLLKTGGGRLTGALKNAADEVKGAVGPRVTTPEGVVVPEAAVGEAAVAEAKAGQSLSSGGKARSPTPNAASGRAEALPLPKHHSELVAKIRSAGRFDTPTPLSSVEEARAIARQALPDAVELPPAVAGQPYPSPPAGVKKWYQVHPPEPGTNELPHIKYADWTGGKKGSGGSWGHIFFRK